MSRNNPIEFIKALRKAADYIDANPLEWDWTKHSNCNCGMVAKSLLEDKVTIFTSQFLSMRGYNWSDWAKTFSTRKPDDMVTMCDPHYQFTRCQVSKLPFKKLFDALIDNGFSWEDFHHLEFTDNPAICRKAGIEPELGQGDNIDRVVQYLRAWADLLCKNQCKLSKESNAKK